MFPTETITNPAQSLAFMKKFSAIGISTILYLRSSLPEEAFTIKNVNGMRVTLLKTGVHSVADKICKMTQSAVQALSKGHLHELDIIFFSGQDSDDVVEKYTFVFDKPAKKREACNSKGDTSEADKDDQAIKKATKIMLKKMSTYMQVLADLPNEAQLSLRLTYNQDTPEDYNPPGFETLSPKSSSLGFMAETPPTPIRMGSIDTTWHKIDVAMQ
jgi:meiosis-specific protein HOP1